MNITLCGSGNLMPILGLGTYKITGSEVVKSTLNSAFHIGYKSIDTAGGYRNESDIGDALKSLLPIYNIDRKDVFITSKLAPKDHGKDKCRQAALKSLENLQIDYLNLYLIHWPGVHGLKPDDPRQKYQRAESWRDLEQLYTEGKLKNIGVSNYTMKHLQELLSYCSVKPAVLQVEYHPHYVQKELLAFCQQQGIHLQAYSSLGTSDPQKVLLNDPAIKEIAANNHKSPAQILLRWAIQQEIGVIPKASSEEHLLNNFQSLNFELSESDMKKLNGLDRQFKYTWDPISVA